MQILFDNWTGRYDDECLMPGDIVEAAMVYNFRENAGNQTDTMIQMGEVADIVGNLPIYDTIYKREQILTMEVRRTVLSGRVTE